ncbi:MAG: glycosyltransferase family 39 protein [Terriglobales bacterium]
MVSGTSLLCGLDGSESANVAALVLSRGKLPHSRYIPNVLSLIREHRRFFLAATLAALAIRLIFFVYFAAVTDDSRVYANLATNWLQHGIYGQTQGTEIIPTDARLPGYPAFLGVIYMLFGVGNFKAVLLAQILIDVGTCLLIADLARRTASDRAAKIAFVLAALCPFLANYAAAELTETLEIFFTTLALDCAVSALNRLDDKGAKINKRWAATGAAIAACILLRPDGGILLAAIVLCLSVTFIANYLRPALSVYEQRALGQTPERAKPPSRRTIVAVVVVTAFALVPLVPWTLRNFRTLHHFQPLAPRYATESDELIPRGFNRWVKTWIADYASVEEIYWNVPGDGIDPQKLPSRAFDNPSQKNATLAAIDEYNQVREMAPNLDARFGRLADERIRTHPFRCYFGLPMARVADMWLRPRTEILPPDPRWWEFNDDPKYSIMAVGFGALNLAYVGVALLATLGMPLQWRTRSLGIRSSALRWSGLMIGFVLLRSAFLLTLENPEPRYTLECYPCVIAFGAAFLAHASARQPRSGSPV